jgi:GT2 family glycosyltransferase
MANVTSVFNDGPSGLSPARNLGVRHAGGDIIAFLDDDAIAFPDWAEQIVGAFAGDDERVAVTGPVYPAWEDESMSWFPEEFLWILSCTMPGRLTRDGPQKVRNVWGVNMSFRRDVFQHCRFSETFVGGNQGSTDSSKLGLLGDDTEFCLQLHARTGRPVVFSPAVRVFHKVYRHRLTSRFIHRRAFWEGYTKAVLAKRYGEGGQRQLDMSTEFALLRSILFRFVPRSLSLLVRKPELMGRRLLLAADVLFHVALGYTAACLPVAGNLITRRYSR